MPIHLYLGPAAGGKTAFAVAQAREAAGALRGVVMVCVANQSQRWAWKERLAGAGGALGVHVLTFGQLYRTLLSATGDSTTLLDDALQHSLLRNTLDDVSLVHYKSLRDKPGFTVLLHNLIAELKAARIGPESLQDAVAALGNELRLRELVCLYAAYQRRLQANGWTDEEELGWLALRTLQNTPQLATDWSLLVVDGFDNLTTTQMDLLRVVTRRARETIITLSGAIKGLERGLVQRRFLVTRRALEEALVLRAESLPEGDWVNARHKGGEGRAKGLVHLERSLFVSQAVPSKAMGDAGARNPVTVIAAADRAGEVRAALRWLKARLVRDGCRLTEVGLLARRVEPYRMFIQETAREFGIPIRLLDGLPLARNPVVAALLDLLRLSLPVSPSDAEPSLPRRLVVEAWRSPYLDWGDPSSQGEGGEIDFGNRTGSSPYAALADRLDAVARWGQVVGGLAQWRQAFERQLECTAKERAEDEEGWPGGPPSTAELQTVQEMFERFVQRLHPPASDRMGDYVRWLEALIGPDDKEKRNDDGSLCVAQCARRGDKPAADRDVAALRALKDVLRSLVWAEQVLGNAPLVNYGAFYGQVRTAVEAATYYLPGEGEAGSVLVGDVVQVRGVPFRAVAVLGLAEGEFPATVREDPLLRDSDRQRLRALGVGLPPSTESAEAEYFYETITRAHSQLLLTRPRLAENGAQWEPSPYWEEVCRLAGVEPVTLSSESRIRPDEAASWPEFLEGLATCPPDSPWHASASAKDAARYRAWQSASSVFEGRYSRRPAGPHNGDLSDHAAELGKQFGPQRVWSATRLESYRTCPQFFFVGTVLGLQPRQEPLEGLDARQLGSIYHELFQVVYEACPESARNDAQCLLATLEDVGASILGEAPRREGFRETAWWLQTQEEILGQVRLSLVELAALAEGYAPVRFELRFDALPIWESPDGQDCLRLHGVVDRVDRCADGACRIIDYKTAGPTHFGRKALQDGRKLQLPLYALAVKQLLGGEIRDGFYWHVPQAKASALRLEAYGVGASMEDALRFAREAVEGIRRGRFEPHPPAEGCPAYCPAAAFCWPFRPAYGG